jgi:ectoine hydroxylase-related dioxygenase (phytanoyl-CoA dioxygenase family)
MNQSIEALPINQQSDLLLTQGYIVLRNLIDEALITKIKNQLSPYLQQKLMGRNDFEGFSSERVYALLAKAPALAAIIEHPQVIELLNQLLPANYLLSANLAINIHPGETVQSWHRDDTAGGMIPLPRPHLGISTIWALDDFTAYNGATEILPGSHQWQDNHPVKESDSIKITMPAGSVLIFLGNMLHRGGANTSTTARLAVTPQYCMPWLRQIENMVLAVPPETAVQYSSRIQAMLGYSVTDPGFMGYVNGVHPKRLINHHYQGRKARGMKS